MPSRSVYGTGAFASFTGGRGVREGEGTSPSCRSCSTAVSGSNQLRRPAHSSSAPRRSLRKLGGEREGGRAALGARVPRLRSFRTTSARAFLLDTCRRMSIGPGAGSRARSNASPDEAVRSHVGRIGARKDEQERNLRNGTGPSSPGTISKAPQGEVRNSHATISVALRGSRRCRDGRDGGGQGRTLGGRR